jgi:hypothetical protein
MNRRTITSTAFLICFLVLPLAMAVAQKSESSNASYTSLGDLIGKDVHGPDDVRMGIVKDVYLSPDGRDVYFILVRGSAFGEIGPFFPIPWHLADPSIRRGRVYIAFDRDTFKGAPGIEVKDWPPTALSPELRQEVREFYQRAAEKEAK